MIKRLLIVVFLVSIFHVGNAQLQANFSIDKPSGCSPLEVRFTNSTAGASQNVVYEWDLGNGNISTLVNPGATYSAEETYTVTLTASDGGIKSTISKKVTVYKKPVINFTANPNIGCVPLNVKLTSVVSAGDGTISNYLWDFGDGNTFSTKDQGTVTHVYTVPQKPPVSLTVINSFGCYTTVDKPNIIEVQQAVIADFTASETFLCNPGSTVNFTNTSTGDGVLSYSWDFGDGATSTNKNPSHIYDSSGSYTVKLLTTNRAGCSGKSKSMVVNVGTFTADFSLPAATCVGQNVTFGNKTTRPFEKIEWSVDNVPVPANNSGNLSYRFPAAGDYTIKLTATHLNCTKTISKIVTVGSPPLLKGFLAASDSACLLPVTFTFTDTTKDVVKWVWRYQNNSTVFDSAQSASKIFTEPGTDKIGLMVTNKEGCSSSITKNISYYNTSIAVVIKKSSSPALSQNRGCPGLAVTFSTTPSNEIVKFSWNLGNGTTSTNPEPSVVYNNLGSYQVLLDYVTKTGCKGTLTFDSIFVTNIQPFDFTVSPDTVICGNSPVVFSPTVFLPNRDYIWLINGERAMYSLTPDPFTYRFQKTGVYTIGLVMQSGSCRDTVTKLRYVRILPPFPKIKSVVNTCAGDRGLVVFTDTTQESTSWKWDFGDGNTQQYATFKPSVQHSYSQSGSYNVRLTATNGDCEITDSIDVYVLLKQNPTLAGDVTAVCTSDSPFLSLSGYETHPLPDSSRPYEITKLQFGDLTNSNVVLDPGDWTTSFRTPVKGLESGKESIRLITTSHYFGCQDTSNFIPLRISGPVAGFTFTATKCFKTPVVLTDTSRAGPSSSIVKWEWFYGDSTSETATNGNKVTHLYKLPGVYQLALRVTDASGCSYQTPADSAHLITITGPAADFSASATDILVNSTVNFTNTSLYFENSELLWRFSDGSVSTEENPSFLFEKEGNHKVMLITKNLGSGCTDTAQKIIEVKKVQSFFNYNISYTDINNCPPAIINFKSESINADRVRWVFGDGGEAGNDLEVSHIYTNSGLFRVVHYSYDASGRVDSVSQVIEVKGPYAEIKADTSYACDSLRVKFNANTYNSASFNWDFGDGTLLSTKDTTVTYLYSNPGVYTPALILVDSGGCSATSQLARKIIVDSLSFIINPNPPAVMCDSGRVRFTADLYSLSKEKLNTAIKYFWSSDLYPGEQITTSTVTYNFFKTGSHEVNLQTTSLYGCKVENVTLVEVKPGVLAGISAPSLVCINDSVNFKGNAIPYADSLQWSWQLGNNVTSNQRNPGALVYTSAGQQPVSLIVSNGFCQDTARYQLNVNGKPQLSVSSSKPYVCEGDTALLMANGGTSITWTPAVNQLINGGYSAIIRPTKNTTYIASVSDSVGCITRDSILMEVVNPFELKVQTPVFTCAGNPIQLLATGATNYQWSGNGFTSNVANPVVLPSSSGIYKVVGSDSYNCFTDSAAVTLNVGQLPTINGGPDVRIVAGQEVKLSTTSSNDVIKWSWQPGRYLQCTDCASPTSKPVTDMVYVVTVTNGVGCIARDTIRIEMICGKELVYIPTGFTPNGDNLNDRFTINGSGIFIKRLAIYDRWGKAIFERKDVSPNDRNSSWDGTYKGEPLGSNSYVYMLDVECKSGEIFTFKGTITLIR
ncbi:MAG: PKD domain-containing protein [Bacteroidota bacterium]